MTLNPEILVQIIFLKHVYSVCKVTNKSMYCDMS